MRSVFNSTQYEIRSQDSSRLKPDESNLHSLDPGIPGSMLNAPSTSVSHLVPGQVAAAPDFRTRCRHSLRVGAI